MSDRVAAKKKAVQEVFKYAGKGVSETYRPAKAKDEPKAPEAEAKADETSADDIEQLELLLK